MTNSLLSAQEVLRYKQRLIDELAKRAREVDAVARETLERSGSTRSQDVDDSVEEAAVARDLEVMRVEDDLARQIHGALQRIAQSTFGVCAGCGRTIERERLDLVPYTRTCAGCAQVDQPGAGR